MFSGVWTLTKLTPRPQGQLCVASSSGVCVCACVCACVCVCVCMHTWMKVVCVDEGSVCGGGGGKWRSTVLCVLG